MIDEQTIARMREIQAHHDTELGAAVAEEASEVARALEAWEPLERRRLAEPWNGDAEEAAADAFGELERAREAFAKALTAAKRTRTRHVKQELEELEELEEGSGAR